MCFRPPEVDLGKMCPACGVENDMAAEVCAECGAKLPVMGGGVPSAPGAPKAPTTPSAPMAPKGSGIPKAPTGPMGK